MNASDLDYELPKELIAQHPLERRDDSRLLVFSRDSGEVRQLVFRDLAGEVAEGTLVVVNDTRVVPARIRIEEPRGEVLLLEPLGGGEWEGLARPTRRLRPGGRYGPVELIEHLGEGRWRLRLTGEPGGEAPLPPYITEPLADPDRYQTVYAAPAGSAAAPTAGPALHARAARAARRRARDPPRRPRHVPAAHRRPRRGSPAPRRALRGEPRGLGAHPGRRPRARRRHDDRPRARDARPRRAARRPHGALHHARLRVPPRRLRS